MDDYIEREGLTKELTRIAMDPCSELEAAEVFAVVANQPAADVAPVRRGRWIEDERTYPGPGLANNVCSVCDELAGTWKKGLKPSEKYPFCPFCGAKMEVQNG